MNFRIVVAALCACLLAGSPAYSAGRSSDQAHSAAAVTRNPDAVRKVQEALNSKGYMTDVNGKWNSKTRAAVKKFQHANGIKATGKLNNRTINALGLAGDAEFSAFHDGDRYDGTKGDGLGAPRHSGPPSKAEGASSYDHSGKTRD